MNQYKIFEGLFKRFYKREDVILDAEMKNYVHFRVGGPADILLIPENKEQVIKSIKICKENNIPYFIVGNGSNLLVKDGGIKGVVIKLNKVKNIRVFNETIEAECGAMLKDVSSEAIKNSLTGFEFACGIPGTVGAEVIDNDGEIKILSREELELGYRSSIIMKKNYIVLSAKFKLTYGEVGKIKEIVEDLTCKRESKQPLEYPSAGSTFKRPTGYYAGKLIQDAGLKGYSIGGAAVSEKHSGFVINKNNATAKDILDLIAHIQYEVKQQFGVDLHPEVRIIGEDEK